MSQRYLYDPSRPFGQRLVAVPLDWRPTPRPRLAVHGVKAPFYSHADGKYYDDHRTYEREVRARGFEIAGNCIKPFLEPDLPKLPPIEQSLKEAADQLGID